MSNARLLVLGSGLMSAALAGVEPDATLSLRLRDASLREVVWVLFRLTEQGYVVDSDVVGRIDVELDGVTAPEVERQLSAFGIFFTGPGTIRRVSTTPVSDLTLPGIGHPVSFEFFKGDTRDVLRVMKDITGLNIVAPAGPLGNSSLFADETATEDQLSAVLASSGLVAKREDDRILVRRIGAPKAVVLPLDVGGLVGHVAYRSGESAGPGQRPAGMEGFLATEVHLWGLATNGSAWAAFFRGPDGRVFLVKAGQRLYDGVVESVDASGAIARTEDGRTLPLGASDQRRKESQSRLANWA